MRPEVVTKVAAAVFDHFDKSRLTAAFEALGWKHVRTVDSSGAWWIHNGVHEVLVVFGGPYQASRPFGWRISGGPLETF